MRKNSHKLQNRNASFALCSIFSVFYEINLCFCLMLVIIGGHEENVGGSRKAQEEETDSGPDPEDLPCPIKWCCR